MFEASPVLIALMAFAAVSGLVFVAGQYLVREIKVQQRIAAPMRQPESGSSLLDGLNAVVLKYFNEKRFKVEGPVRSELRQKLLRAGFFHADAISYYIFWRIGLVIGLPVLGYAIAVILLYDYGPLAKLGLVVLMTVLAILGPDAYIARRQRLLTDEYATTFPDLLDLMVVCVDAGLGLEAALDRISREMIKKSRRARSMRSRPLPIVWASMRRARLWARSGNRSNWAATWAMRSVCSATRCGTSACCARRSRPTSCR